MSLFDENEMEGFDFLEDACATITMFDEDGNEVEFIIVSSLRTNGVSYLLVLNSVVADDDEPEGIILKEVKEVTEEGDTSFFEAVNDDEEFDKIAALFKNCADDYEIEF